MSLFLLLVLGLLQTAEDFRVTQTPLHVTRGDDVTLDLPDPEPIENYDFLHWISNTDIVLALRSGQGCAVYDSNKCELHPQNGSLTLKNLQEEDSGLYEAQVIKKMHEINYLFHVSVQAPKSPVKVRPVSSSQDTNGLRTVYYKNTDNEPEVTPTKGMEEVSTKTTGSSPQRVFVETNQDLLLRVTEGKNGDVFLWISKNNTFIVRVLADNITLNNDYKDRVEFFPQNISLLLKNVQLSDSGIYTAVVSRKTDVIVSEYDVTVQAPVSPVLLRVDSVSNSPESCNFTVSCRTELFSISRSFTCDRHTCEEASPAPSGPAHFGFFSLSLSLSISSITCNYSNAIGWTEDAKDIKQVCTSETESVSAVSWCVVKTVVFSVGLLLMVSAVITAHVLDHTRKKRPGSMAVRVCTTGRQ